MYRSTEFAFTFHNFWLTRRGMFFLAINLAESDQPTARDARKIFLRPERHTERSLLAEAARCLKKPKAP